MIAIWIAIGIVAALGLAAVYPCIVVALGLAAVYACIVAGSDADDESERWKESRCKEEDER